jgi:serralysin
MALPNWTDQQVIDQLVTPYKWYSSSISYSFPKTSSEISGTDQIPGFSSLNSNQQKYARLAVLLWDDLIIPNIYETNNNSQIEFGLSNTGVNYAIAYYPNTGSVWFNKNESSLTTPIIGEHGFYTYIHEIGHALGLDHMGDYNGEGTWTPSSFQDSTVYTVMSYFGPDWDKGKDLVAWADWTGTDGKLYSPETPGINDILAIQKIYGAAANTRTGNTIYGFNSNIIGDLADIYNFSLNKNPIVTIYDSGGTDTLDLSSWRGNSLIDLMPGAFSSGNAMTKNIAIAYSTIIENATGGTGDDAISGNTANNKLQGNLGSDSINGQNGFDTAIFHGKLNEYQITFNSTTETFTISDTNSARDGIDTLNSVEYLQFSDQLIDISNLVSKFPTIGTLGNDNFKAIISNQAYDGLAGFDVLTFSGTRAEYMVTLKNSTVASIDGQNSRDGIDSFINIEKLSFQDGSLIYDIANTTDNSLVYRLYQAAFARSPDEGGFRHWSKAKENGLALDNMADYFRDSPEFKLKYGSNLTTQDYVNQLYLNVLGRAGEETGQNYWINTLETNKLNQSQVMCYFADSPENKLNTASNIDNGYWVL